MSGRHYDRGTYHVVEGSRKVTDKCARLVADLVLSGRGEAAIEALTKLRDGDTGEVSDALRDARRERDAAWESMVTDIEGAWEHGPGTGADAPGIEASTPPGNLRDAMAAREAAREAYEQGLEDAWQG